MKVTQNKQFVPVVITLETQEEVDALHGIFNSQEIGDILEPALKRRACEFLGQFATPRNYNYFQQLRERMK